MSRYSDSMRNLLDDYFIHRTAYAKQLRDERVSPEVEEQYLKDEAELLLLLGAE